MTIILRSSATQTRVDQSQYLINLGRAAGETDQRAGSEGEQIKDITVLPIYWIHIWIYLGK